MPATARSLADDLRERDAEALVALLVARPDLARPAPVDLTTLAARATTRASVQRALDGLDLAHLQALEAVCAIGPATQAQLAALLGEGARSARVRDLVDELCGLALCWRSPDGIRAARTVLEVVGDPAGLGPAIDGAPTGTAFTSAMEGITAAEQALLDALTWGPSVGVLSTSEASDAAASTGAARMAAAGAALVDRGLLHRVDSQRVLLPRQVALALRGGRLHRHPALAPPQLDAPVLETELVDATTGARAGELLDIAAEVLADWGSRPPRVLRGGGLSVRDLGRTARLIEVEVDQAAWLVEVLQAAGLVAMGELPDDAPRATPRGRAAHAPVEEMGWLPTGESDDWAELPAAEQWARLAQAWLTMSSAPSLVGQTDGTGRVNALSVQVSWPAARQHRRDTLAALAALPPGTAPTAEQLADLLRWQHPVRMSGREVSGVETALLEAEWAGVTGRGALGAAGRALVEHPGEAGLRAGAAALAPHVPAGVEHVLLQADLTAVAPGRLDGAARHLMRLIGTVESRGGATVHRITEVGIRTALDHGWTADRLLREIDEVSRTGVPQPLEYLVRDVARRHGVARVGSVASYLRSDDPALLDRALADRTLGLLQLRRIAPTVLVSPVPATTVLDVLREQQYGPVTEGIDGGVALTGRELVRSSRPKVPPVQVSVVDDELAAQIVGAMRRGEAARPPEGKAGLPSPTDPVVTQSLLREAAAERVPVWIGYADDVGGVRRFLLRPTLVEAGRVRGTIDDQDVPRTFLLHRISGVRPTH